MNANKNQSKPSKEAKQLKRSVRTTGAGKVFAKAGALAAASGAAAELLVVTEQPPAMAVAMGTIALASAVLYAGKNRKGFRLGKQLETVQATDTGHHAVTSRLAEIRQQIQAEKNPPALTEKSKPIRNWMKKTFRETFLESAPPERQARIITSVGNAAITPVLDTKASRLEQIRAEVQIGQDLGRLNQSVPETVPEAPLSFTPEVSAVPVEPSNQHPGGSAQWPR